MNDPVPPVAADAHPDLPGHPMASPSVDPKADSMIRVVESLNIRRVELELAEQQLQAECESLSGQRDHYRSLFEHLPLPAVVMESSGSLCGANDLALTLLGIDAADVVHGRRLCASLGPGCQTAMVAALTQRQRVARVAAELRRADGVLVPCTLHLSPLPVSGVPRWLVVLDVAPATPDLQTDLQEARFARVRAEQANSAKDSFLAHMSHEVRTPMSNVMGLLRLVLDTPLTPEQRKHLLLASESADDLLTIANDIVDLSRMEADALPVDAVPLAPRDALS